MHDQAIERLGGTADIGGAPIGDDDIATVKELIHTELPVEYVSFARRWGGAALARTVRFAEPATGEHQYISFFYGGGDDRLMRLDAMVENYRQRIPDGWIPIGGDGFGNQTCLKVAEPGRGSVGFWDHEQEDLPDADGPAGEVTLVAPSFNQWLSSLEAVDN